MRCRGRGGLGGGVVHGVNCVGPGVYPRGQEGEDEVGGGVKEVGGEGNPKYGVLHGVAFAAGAWAPAMCCPSWLGAAPWPWPVPC